MINDGLGFCSEGCSWPMPPLSLGKIEKSHGPTKTVAIFRLAFTYSPIRPLSSLISTFLSIINTLIVDMLVTLLQFRSLCF